MTEQSLKKIIAVVGPTAAGKSEIAKALADEFGGFIISADARMLYHGLDIGTNKPSTVDRARYRYEMLDVVEPDKEYNLALYQQAVFKLIDSSADLPILEGGTGLYVSAIIDNFSIPEVPPNPALRRRLESQSAEALYHQLQAVDPESAAVIDPQNKRRLTRALELKLLAGLSRSAATKAPTKYNTLQLGINRDRAELYQRINDRVEEMFDNGFIEEVQSLLDVGYSSSLPSLSSIGYQEVARHLAGELTLNEAKSLIKKNTRQYAKRQLTWWRRDQRVKWINTADEAIALTREFLTPPYHQPRAALTS